MVTPENTEISRNENCCIMGKIKLCLILWRPTILYHRLDDLGQNFACCSYVVNFVLVNRIIHVVFGQLAFYIVYYRVLQVYLITEIKSRNNAENGIVK